MKLTMKGKGGSLIQAAAVVAVAGLFGSEVAMAGADTTFNTALTSFTGFLEGSGGKFRPCARCHDWNDSVSTGAEPVHPVGHPRIHSSSQGRFGYPPRTAGRFGDLLRA